MKRHRKWLPRSVAQRIPYSGADSMGGGNRRGITIHDEGVTRPCDGGQHVINLAKYVRDRRIFCHAVYCDRCGKWAQIIPFHKAARSMKGGDVDGRGNSANRAGTVNIQICLAGRNAHSGVRPDWSKARNLWVLAMLEQSWNIPNRQRDDRGRSKTLWASGGVCGHMNGPHDNHADPGSINLKAMMREARKQWAAKKGGR